MVWHPGSFCFWFKLLALEAFLYWFFKKVISNVSGERAWKFILLTLIQCADFRICLWAFSQRNKGDPHRFFCSSPSMIYKLGWPESHQWLSFLWPAQWETRRDSFTSHHSDQTRTCTEPSCDKVGAVQVPVILGCYSVQRYSWQGRRFDNRLRSQPYELQKSSGFLHPRMQNCFLAHKVN